MIRIDVIEGRTKIGLWLKIVGRRLQYKMKVIELPSEVNKDGKNIWTAKLKYDDKKPVPKPWENEDYDIKYFDSEEERSKFIDDEGLTYYAPGDYDEGNRHIWAVWYPK